MPYEVSPAEFAPIVREFASYKLGIQGCSPKTVNEYLFDLRTFFRYLIAKEQDIAVESDLFTQIDVSGMDLTRISAITTSLGFGISISPASPISKTPISLVEPNLFFIALTIL